MLTLAFPSAAVMHTTWCATPPTSMSCSDWFPQFHFWMKTDTCYEVKREPCASLLLYSHVCCDWWVWRDFFFIYFEVESASPGGKSNQAFPVNRAVENGHEYPLEWHSYGLVINLWKAKRFTVCNVCVNENLCGCNGLSYGQSLILSDDTDAASAWMFRVSKQSQDLV